ncbi:MAG: LLM class flavin-dependent oxidoreductase [Candidatus Bathyarchaeia archaeon]|nr:LLM class flavin-dependent oxidoreductase [Candidatus Bathyarchaeia archaeon]
MLKIGVVGPTFPPIESIARVAKSIEEKGYDSIWFPDHLMGWFPQTIWTSEIVGPFAMYSPHTFFETTLSMAVAASSTNVLRIGSAVTEAIRHHPAMLAQSYATLEHITNGRAILGMGAGELENIEPYGLKYEKAVSRLEEALQIIRLLWESGRDELINYDGKFFKLKDAVFELPPVRRRPPIWIGGAGERMCRIAARYADGWLPFTLNVEEYAKRLSVIKEECNRAGRNFDEIERGLYLNLIIDEIEEECLKLMKAPLIKAGALLAPATVYKKLGYKHPLGENFYSLTDYVPSKYSKEEIIRALEHVPMEVVQESFLWGNVEGVIDKLDKYRKVGVQTVVFWNFTFLGDATKVKSSYSCIDQLVNYFKEK